MEALVREDSPKLTELSLSASPSDATALLSLLSSAPLSTLSLDLAPLRSPDIPLPISDWLLLPQIQKAFPNAVVSVADDLGSSSLGLQLEATSRRLGSSG